MANGQLLFQHNWTVVISKCFIYCKNPHKRGEKYKIEFNFLDGEKYAVEFNDKAARDKHYRFFIRMMYQNYTPQIHWIIHIMCLFVFAIIAMTVLG